VSKSGQSGRLAPARQRPSPARLSTATFAKLAEAIYPAVLNHQLPRLDVSSTNPRLESCGRSPDIKLIPVAPTPNEFRTLDRRGQLVSTAGVSGRRSSSNQRPSRLLGWQKAREIFGSGPFGRKLAETGVDDRSIARASAMRQLLLRRAGALRRGAEQVCFDSGGDSSGRLISWFRVMEKF